ncbi:lipase [Luteitalea sp. TBR-22]|uniref:alpha/beta hydrolase family protein n=1 Tax=Luteitalea sp. TBR-22 TaxID=2802971 RepID=UPI001AF5F9B2|nr:hypothetical protein [Luteitalea sp. TBR-22]BCS34532.1 lipase [Luteitalea sp. TBR-22]
MGVRVLHLTDPSRPELATVDPNDVREVVVHLWYPAQRAPGAVRAPYFLDPLEAALNAQVQGLPDDAFDGLRGWAVAGARMVRGRAARPLVLFSGGLQTPPAFYASVVADLASRGLVVAVVAHPYSSGVSVLPGGRVAFSPDPFAGGSPEQLHQTWVEDMAFVLDTLTRDASALDAADHRGGAVMAMGHSFGGAAAASLAVRDTRVSAAANLDGTFWGAALTDAIATPFLMLTAERSVGEPTRDRVLAALQAPGYDLRLLGSAHNDVTDFGVLLPRLVELAPGLSPEVLELGAIDATRALDLTTAYLASFVDRHLLGRRAPLLDRPQAFEEAVLTLVGSH